MSCFILPESICQIGRAERIYRCQGLLSSCILCAGGPLGELVQWSDIISALYILGHDLTITSEVEQLQA